MKRLILMRHGKAEVGKYGIPDFERVLAEKGKQDAALISQKVKALQIQVDSIYSSTSKRTASTAKIVAEQLDINTKNILGDASIYDASPTFMKSFISELNDELTTVLIAGHNPTQTFLIDYYTAGNLGNLPTSGLAILEFEIDSWKETSYNTAILSNYFYPKGLM